VAVDLFSVTPWDVDEAKRVVSRIEETWRRFHFARVDEAGLASQAAAVRQSAAELESRRNQWREYRAEADRWQAKAQALRRALWFWQAWQRPALPVTLAIGGLLAGLLLAVLTGRAVSAALGALSFVLAVCLASLVIAAWFLTREEWAAARIASLPFRIQDVENRGRQSEARAQSAGELFDASRQRWREEEDRYRRMAYLCRVRDDYERARRRYDALFQAIQSRQYRLLHQDWRSLRGVDFETFLRQVFEVLGYSVRMTKATGDQGIDLLLTGKGKKIGVQAKGATGSVGNSAVQQANTGSQFYRCDCCAVVTNSYFSRHAKELARAVACRLISGADIPPLIMGKIDL
jgi:hypothetical protein